jgi:hypothetical protein
VAHPSVRQRVGLLLAGAGLLLTLEDDQDVDLTRVVLILHGHRPQQARAWLLDGIQLPKQPGQILFLPGFTRILISCATDQ